MSTPLPTDAEIDAAYQNAGEARALLVYAWALLEGGPIADAVAAAYTPSGPSRDELTQRIRARRGLAPTEGTTR